VSERLIAETLDPYPDELVIATKGGLLRPGPNQWTRDGRPEHLRAACEGSRKRLRVEQIDVYQRYRPDPNVPIEESVGALGQLKAEGKIRNIGLSNVTVELVERAQKLTPIVSVQNRYSAFDRASEPVLEFCSLEEIAFLPGRPVEGGGRPAPGVAPPRAPGGIRRRRPRWPLPGCWRIHRSCCPSREPPGWPTSRRTSARLPLSWPRPSSPRSTRLRLRRGPDRRGPDPRGP